ncbi:MAG: hypothetical protein IT454_16530 [Planctomycetes bacterium]|nr:hypothetical protein [Planctomycetota bacterium]
MSELQQGRLNDHGANWTVLGHSDDRLELRCTYEVGYGTAWVDVSLERSKPTPEASVAVTFHACLPPNDVPVNAARVELDAPDWSMVPGVTLRVSAECDWDYTVTVGGTIDLPTRPVR